MKVKQLKKLLDTMDGECFVVIKGYDHSYDEADACDATAGIDSDYHLSEWFGFEHASPGERPIRVVVIG